MKKLLSLFLISMAACSTARAATEMFSFNDVNLAIPDGPSYGASDTQPVASSIVSITSLRVTLNISGDYNGDLYASLQHSSGFSVLLNRAGRSTGNPFGYADSGFSITLDDAAANGDIHDYQTVTVPGAGSQLTGTWQPDARNVDPADALDTSSRTAFLSNFDGLDASGDWTLFLADIEFGAASTLNSWSLDVSGLEVIPEPTNVALGIFASLLAGWTLLGKLRARVRAGSRAKES